MITLANIRRAIYCINKRLDLLESGGISGGNSSIQELQNKVSTLELLISEGNNPTQAIDKFNEIVAFLDSIKNTETLSGIIGAIQQDIGSIRNSLPTVMGGSGSRHKSGLVPDPGATAGTTKYLREDGTWVAPSIPDVSNYIQKSQTAGLVKNDGTIDTNTYLTQHQDISSKEDTITIVAYVNQTDATLPINALTCEVGKYYRLDVAVETLAVTLPEMSDVSILRGCVIYMTIGTTPAITFTGTAHGGVTPPVYCYDGFSLESGKTYEVNCIYNGGAWIVVSVTIDVTNVTLVQKGGKG